MKKMALRHPSNGTSISFISLKELESLNKYLNCIQNNANTHTNRGPIKTLSWKNNCVQSTGFACVYIIKGTPISNRDYCTVIIIINQSYHYNLIEF